MPTERQLNIILESEVEFQTNYPTPSTLPMQKETTQPTIEEMNRAMFDFMGCKHSQHAAMDAWEMSRLRYHTSWDALMPVVQKIEALGYCVFIQNDACWIKPCRPRLKYRDDFLGASKINAVYTIVYQFIQWYNKQLNNGESNKAG